MELWNKIKSITRNKEPVAQEGPPAQTTPAVPSIDLSDIYDMNSQVHEVYLKCMALDICANFVARAIGQSEFKINNDLWRYKLNVRPNKNASSTLFWEQLIYRLIVENEVLIILSDTDDLLIADSWVRNEYAVYGDTFEGVVVKDYIFKRTFQMHEVLFLEYNNRNLRKFTDGLFRDYSELYERMLEAVKRNNQIRGTLSMEANKPLDDDSSAMLNDYVKKLFQSISQRPVSITPLIKGFEYSEHSNTTGTSNINMDEVNKIPEGLINLVADALGIPTALLHGNRAELKDNMIAFNKYCVAPLLKKIEDELNAKIIEMRGYARGERVEVIGINRPDLFDLAHSIDKLISSGALNPNEIRKELGYEPREGGDQYVRTKNYEIEGREVRRIEDHTNKGANHQ